MFRLSDGDLKGKIAGFGDGPACFNRELTERGGSVISFDVIYQFTGEDARVEAVIEKVRGKAREYGADEDMVETLYREMIKRFIGMETREFKGD